jgi:hypothetical protein
MGIETLMNAIRDAVDAQLISSADDLLAQAIALAPVESDKRNEKTGKLYREGGVLKKSGYMRENHIDLYHRRVDVVFDTRILRPNKDDFNYAIIQHEKQMNHLNGGQWKYLETPYKSNIDLYRANIGEAIDGVVNGAGAGVLLGNDVGTISNKTFTSVQVGPGIGGIT